MSAAIFRSISLATKPKFRVSEFSIQGDHLHLIVEAANRGWLARGLQGLGVRVARAVNRALGRIGSVFADRYHARALRTPTEVRHALAYVLGNRRKHLRDPLIPPRELSAYLAAEHWRDADPIDDRSSAPWFTGWAFPARPRGDPAPTAPSDTWLGTAGWRRLGLLSPRELAWNADLLGGR